VGQLRDLLFQDKELLNVFPDLFKSASVYQVADDVGGGSEIRGTRILSHQQGGQVVERVAGSRDPPVEGIAFPPRVAFGQGQLANFL
jgi:hypothetical protein